MARPSGRAAAAPVLRDAARLAREHVPLSRAVTELARIARIVLDPPSSAQAVRPVEAPRPFGLTQRELVVLHRLGAGDTNAQIAASLYISTSTAGVHVTNILRKLAVTSRVQAAAVASRLGLLDELGDGG